MVTIIDRIEKCALSKDATATQGFNGVKTNMTKTKVVLKEATLERAKILIALISDTSHGK